MTKRKYYYRLSFFSHNDRVGTRCIGTYRWSDSREIMVRVANLFTVKNRHCTYSRRYIHTYTVTQYTGYSRQHDVQSVWRRHDVFQCNSNQNCQTFAIHPVRACTLYTQSVYTIITWNHLLTTTTLCTWDIQYLTQVICTYCTRRLIIIIISRLLEKPLRDHIEEKTILFLRKNFLTWISSKI